MLVDFIPQASNKSFSNNRFSLHCVLNIYLYCCLVRMSYLSLSDCRVGGVVGGKGVGGEF